MIFVCFWVVAAAFQEAICLLHFCSRFYFLWRKEELQDQQNLRQNRRRNSFDIHQDVKRTVIPFEEMGDAIKDATLAIEDKDFYQHKGVQPKAFIRAVVVNLKSGSFLKVVRQSHNKLLKTLSNKRKNFKNWKNGFGFETWKRNVKRWYFGDI